METTSEVNPSARRSPVQINKAALATAIRDWLGTPEGRATVETVAVVASDVLTSAARWLGGLTKAPPVVAARDALSSYLASPAFVRHLAIAQALPELQATVRAVELVVYEENRQPKEIARITQALGISHARAGAAVVLAAGRCGESQRVRLGTQWVKKGERVALIVPRDGLAPYDLWRHLRALSWGGLPSTPKRTRNDRRGAARREVAAELERLAAPAAPDQPLVAREPAELLQLVAMVGVATPRELDVLRLRLEGCSKAETARRLGIAPSTARNLMLRLRGRRMPTSAREIVAAV